jgi:hypothetical protein
MFTTGTNPTLTYRLAVELLEARRREVQPPRRFGLTRGSRKRR